MLGYTWKTRGIIFATNILVIAVFVGIGHLLDRAFDKKAFFIFLALLISFPLPTILVRKMIKKERAKKARGVSSENLELDTISVKDYIR